MATKFDELLDLAADQHGLVRVKEATAHGVASSYLRKLASEGRLERVARGVYRVPALAGTVNDQYAEAVLWADGRGVISHSSALALHDLCDVNPSRLHLTVPARYAPRRAGGALYRVWRRDLPSDEVTYVDSIPVVTAYRAILDAAFAGEDPAMVAQAIRAARSRGDITAAEAARLRRLQLRHQAAAKRTVGQTRRLVAAQR